MPKESKKNQKTAVKKPRKAAAKKSSAAAKASANHAQHAKDKRANVTANVTVIFRAGERGVRYVGMSDTDSDSFAWIAAGLCRVGDVVYEVLYDDIKDLPPGTGWQTKRPIVILPTLDARDAHNAKNGG